MPMSVESLIAVIMWLVKAESQIFVDQLPSRFITFFLPFTLNRSSTIPQDVYLLIAKCLCDWITGISAVYQLRSLEGCS
ncbi:hypothetical protein K435DRAFT_974680 [Dendrothele bispora CBS 962.96]|uniref:Uncharacterized protein n=1 Tax=Dendrothele bispora (strain CBS 962.96) TaxID=1314807 RepID=A0A4S8KJY2_DENBC|nr:hypothetical protein K435DRAFT_974680 [Dendrothele bispora CBS 962.96]